MAMSWNIIRAEIVIYPVFQPNDYLFETHADKGDEKWEVYAWACRDLMAKVGGFGKHDITYKQKFQVYRYYAGQSETYKYDEIEEEEKSKDAKPSQQVETEDDIKTKKVQ